MKKSSTFNKGIKLLLAATLIFLVLLVTVHSIFVDMGLSGIENSSGKIIKYIEEKLDLYESYQLNTEEDVTLQKVFDGMMLDHKGVLLITKDDELVASNKDGFDSYSGEYWEELSKESILVEKNLGKVQYEGKRWYISESEYKDYKIYVMFPSNAVYQIYYVGTLILVILYLVVLGLVLVAYSGFERKHYKRMEKYYQTMDAVSGIYMANMLVSLKDNSYHWLKCPEWIRDKVKDENDARSLIQKLSEIFVQAPYRENFLQETDIRTVQERIKGKQSITFTYEDVEEHWVTITIVPEKTGENEEVESVLYLLRNVTEEMEREKNYQKQLKLAGDAKTNFLRRMSHDIRTPINGIRGIVEIADHNPNDLEKQQECRAKVMVASGYLLDLVNNVLDMSKLESGEVKLEHRPFNLTELLKKANEITTMQCRDCGITYHTSWYEVTHTDLIGSPVHLQQVLLNLAGNAVKYNKENGHIYVGTREISCTEDTAEYEFTCRDTGIGMSEEFQKHIFEPFSQENENGRTKYAGTGLGMSIAKELTELQGGTISLKSTEGEGSEFTVRISFEIDHGKRKKEIPKEGVVYSIKEMKILLVEDNDLNMEVAEYLLKEEGAVITKAWNGQEAVDIFAGSDVGYFDAVLMDVMMPVMGGLEAAEKIRQMNREDAGIIPIIAMSANAFQDDIEMSLKAGMNEHLTKPLDMKLLIKTLSKEIKGRR